MLDLNKNTGQIMKLLKSYLLPILLINLTACGSGSDDKVVVVLPVAPTITETIDNYLAENQTNNEAGISVLIRKNNQVVYRKSKGLANKFTEESITNQTGFRVGSVTKPFTAIAIMQLVEQGLLQLSDPISLFIPQSPSAYADITVEQLLNHQSGIPDYINDEDNLTHLHNLTTTEFISLAIASGANNLEFEPGTSAQYSNTGYVILAEIVYRVTGLSLPEYLQIEIYDKLGMSQSYMISENRQMGDMGESVALSMAQSKEVYAVDREDYTFNALIYGSSGQVSSIDDMNIFLQALKKGDIISQQTLAKMTQPLSALPEIGDYGLGWITGTGNYWHNDKYTSEQDYWHSGGYGGYRSLLSISPALDLEVVVLTNGGDKTQDHTWNILELSRNFYR